MLKINKVRKLFLTVGLGSVFFAHFPASASEVSARIKAITCVMSLTAYDIKWNVGIITRADNTVNVLDNSNLLKRKVLLEFSDPGYDQMDPITGEKFECTKANEGFRLVFKAKDRPTAGDIAAGAIPDVNTGERYFEYYVTYNYRELSYIQGTQLNTYGTTPKYKNQDAVPLTGIPSIDYLEIYNKTGYKGITLGSYPFYVWLVDSYQNPNTSPTIQSPNNSYKSSITITATYL